MVIVVDGMQKNIVSNGLGDITKKNLGDGEIHQKTIYTIGP
jgi:hypothetical protein